MQNVFKSMSTHTGLAPTLITEFAVAGKLKSGIITSSPPPICSTSKLKWSPVVAELVTKAYLLPAYSQISLSNRAEAFP